MAEEFHTRQTLIDRVRDQNDEQAWSEFIALYEGYIYAIIRKMGISPADTKDIHQDVLLQIWKNLPDYQNRPGKRFRSWVSTITSNAVRYFMRSRSNKAKTLDRLEGEATTAYLSW